MSASSSSYLLAPSRWRYDVFPSFSGQDVRRNFLSHLVNEFNRKGINSFLDDQIPRSESIGPELLQAIRASRIGVVILTKNYASSSWCLDELLEIIEREKAKSQKVMTIFYDMDPADVRKQTGDFGEAFMRTCVGKTEERKQSWREALTYVANIAGEHSDKWDSEAAMILKISTDITNMLNVTPSRDFDQLVGIEAHIAKMNSLLCRESNEVRVVGIWGPAGIGKTTMARALYDRVSGDFQLSVFMENVKGSYSRNELDSYSSKLRLQEQFLSEMLNLKDMRIQHLGVAGERLSSQKVFIVLDDVDKLEQLEALANERWFGAGSRIIVTTEHKYLLKGHDINHIYEVNFPSDNEALRIFSRSAFKQDSPPEGFMELAVKVTRITNNLPLGLCVLGSSMRGKSKIEWAHELPTLQACLHGDIEKILKVSYDSLGNDDKYKTTFLHIACLFNGEEEDRVIQLLENSIRDIKYRLDVLVERALVYISSNKHIIMHHLLQKLGREIVGRQAAHEPGKRQFLVDAQEIYDVLADETGTTSVLGISLNMSEINDLFLGDRAFSGMHNLQFLRFYKRLFDKARLHLHEGLDCLPLPRKLTLLHWEACPMKEMSNRFRPECLVEINMTRSKLKKLWNKVRMPSSLKKMDLSYSISLEELPDLSEALNLEHLNLQGCTNLRKLPSSIWKLRMLNFLDLHSCKNLEPLPANYALKSLSFLNIGYCLKFVDFPEISSEVEEINVSYNPISAVPASIEDWNCLHTLQMTACENIVEFPRVPSTLSVLDLAATRIKEVPPWISDLYGLKVLRMEFCTELREVSPNICELGNLKSLNFEGCYNVRKFPAEIFQSCYTHHDLMLTLINIGKNSLPMYTPEKTEDFDLVLEMSKNDFVSIPDSVVQRVQSLNLIECRKLVSLPELPGSLSKLYADNCVSLERLTQSSRSPHDPKLILNLVNCFKLDQEARKLVIEQWTCGYAVLPGSVVPDYFTHQASGSSLTIHLNQRNLYGPLRFKACVVLPRGDGLSDVPYRRFQISCHIRGRHSTTVYKWPAINEDDTQDGLLDNHLFILNSYFTLEEDNIPESDMIFDFSCLVVKLYPDTVSSNLLGCGVQLLEPCSCKHDSTAHPLLSTLPLKVENDGKNSRVAETRRSNQRERSSVPEGPGRTSKNLRIGN